MEMSRDQAVITLRREAARNPVVNDVCHVFAARKRARHQVTVRALSLRMKKEGFAHKDAEYAEVLSLLSDTGFGTLEKDRKGRVVALKNVKTTLQSLGKAVIGQKQELEALHLRNKFSALAPAAQLIKQAKVTPIAPNTSPLPAQLAVYPYRATGSISITLTINKKPVIIPLPATLTPEEIASLIKHFQDTMDKVK